MGNKELHLYVGLSKQLADKQVKNILHVIKARHPNAVQDEILDGYWSGIEETTLLFKVETSMSYLLETVDMVSSVHSDLFIAIDEPDS